MSGIKALPPIKSSLLRNLGIKLRADFLTNWRLVLLGLTGIVLSLASGWTTYDGMTNFTKTPILSLMITFGIQGVMLVTAWLIGESFATGATGEDNRRSGTFVSALDIMRKAGQLFLSIFVLMTISFILAKFALNYDISEIQKRLSLNLYNIVTILGLIMFVALFLVLFSRAEIIGPYARGMRIILAHLPLWLMFLACMATSVFFSFDSLFSTIFPAEERERAGELRARGQISGMIADVDATIEKRRIEASGQFLLDPSWKTYEGELSRLLTLVRSAPGEIEQEFVRKMQERQKALAEQQKSLSDAQSQKQNLTIERDQLKASLERIEAQQPERQAAVDALDNQLRTKEQELATREAEAKAERRGVGETGKEGRGPKFRELDKLVTKLKIDMDALKTQLANARQALEENDRRRVSERARLLEVEQKISTRQSEAQSAEETLKVQKELQNSNDQLKLDASGGLKTLEQELSKFRQQPSRQTLANIQQICGQLTSTINQVPSLKDKAGALNCDPQDVNDKAGEVFALADAQTRYREICGKEAKLPASGTDALLDFGQQCILMSALPGTDTQKFRLSLNRIALNRDDKAHRFVVTWNAFADGNRLAYLSLIIAIAIDSLVFMSGLFGANAIVSPLADSPQARSRPVAKLEEIVDNALLPDRGYASELVLNVMHPRLDNDKNGYMASINLKGLAFEQHLVIKKVLTAGASLGLVKHDETDTHSFLIRSELFEYLSSVRAYETKRGYRSTEAAMPRYGIEQGQAIPLKPVQHLKAETVEEVTPKLENKPQDLSAQVHKLTASAQIASSVIADSKEERRYIRSAYLKALGLDEASYFKMEKLKIGHDPVDWQNHLDDLERDVPKLVNRIGEIQDANKQALKETYERLKDHYRDHDHLLHHVEDYAEDFEKQLPEITIWKAYQHSKKQAEALRDQIQDSTPLVNAANEDIRSQIIKLRAKLEEAEENKIDGWADLENASQQLSGILKGLKSKV